MSTAPMYRILVFGSDVALSSIQKDTIFSTLDGVLARPELLDYDDTEILLLDEQRGVGSPVRGYARREAVGVHHFTTDWAQYGVGARTEVLTRMLSHRPQIALCFVVGHSLDVRSRAVLMTKSVETEVVDL